MYLRVVHRRYTTDLNNFPRTFLAYFDDDDRQPSSRWIEPIKCTYIYIYIYSVFLLLPSSFLSLPFFVYNTSLYLSCLIPLHILDIYLRDLCPPLPFLRVSVCTSTPYGRSHERDRWNAHRYTHTRARLRAEEPLMNLAVLRPPVRVSPWERTNGKTVSDVYENRISPFFFLSLSPSSIRNSGERNSTLGTSFSFDVSVVLLLFFGIFEWILWKFVFQKRERFLFSLRVYIGEYWSVVTRVETSS